MFFMSCNVMMLIFFLEVPNQKYKISTKSNKVYDLTERKVSITTLIALYYYCIICENVNFLLCVVISVFVVTSATKLPNILSYKSQALLFG